jgi:predicted anti-sigma-YlaC factor YlaD
MGDTTLLSCREIRDLLPSYLNGDVDVHTAQQMRWHFGQCRDCRTIIRSAIETFRMDFDEKRSRRSLPKAHAA